MTLRVLINAGPWLPVPPDGYGGIENVVAALVPKLRMRAVYVVLATVGRSRVVADETFAVFDQPRFGQLQQPYNRAMGCAMAHIDAVVREVRRRGDIDLVHDHLEAVGLTVLAAMGSAAPPVLHTLHWDLRKHPELYGSFDGGGRVFVNGVSAAQLATAPAALRAHSLGHVHLATPLADPPDASLDAAPRPSGHGMFIREADHSGFYLVLGRITPGKGQHVAARLAHRAGFDVVLAGPVGPYQRPNDLVAALAGDPEAERNPDVRFWLDEVAPHVDGQRVRWLGNLPAAERNELLVRARATVFPLNWEEPGGTAVVESLALGTPVVGYRRGCLPELVDEGETGFLVEPGDEETLVQRLRQSSGLHPGACRRAAAERFAPAVMAERYLRLYTEVLARSGTSATGPLSVSS